MLVAICTFFCLQREMELSSTHMSALSFFPTAAIERGMRGNLMFVKTCIKQISRLKP